MASYATPQNLNRYSYVSNNPIRNSDPTGHLCVGDPGECLDENGNTGSGFTNGGTPTHHYVPKPSKPKNNNDGDETGNPLLDILQYYLDGVDVMESNGCMNSASNFVANATCLDYASTLSQDLATFFSAYGASTTLLTTLLGCVSANGVGCAAGYATGVEIYLLVMNPLETSFSTASFFTTAYSDYLTGDTYFNSWTDWNFGEDTKTGFFTTLAGALAPQPFIDTVIDTYSSGYNHGYFCGISTILGCF